MHLAASEVLLEMVKYQRELIHRPSTAGELLDDAVRHNHFRVQDYLMSNGGTEAVVPARTPGNNMTACTIL